MAVYNREVALIRNQVRNRVKKTTGIKASREQIQRLKDLRKDLGINTADLCRTLLQAEKPKPSRSEEKEPTAEPIEEPEVHNEAKDRQSEAKELMQKPREARVKRMNKRRRDESVRERENSRALLSNDAVEKLVESRDMQEVMDLEGWGPGPQVLEMIAKKGWIDPLTTVGRKASTRVMALLKEQEKGVVVFPFTEASSHTFEALDRMVAIPFCVPTALMVRKTGKTITNMPWIVVRFGPKAEAEAFRDASCPYFRSDGKESEVHTKEDMTTLWPRKPDGDSFGGGTSIRHY